MNTRSKFIKTDKNEVIGKKISPNSVCMSLILVLCPVPSSFEMAPHILTYNLEIEVLFLLVYVQLSYYANQK